MNNKEDILKKLFSLQRFGIKPGLERTLKLADYCGNPHLKFPSIHVAGTNGKGSVCAMLASVLMEAGYKVGLYTSPHLVSFNERIRINKSEISDDEMIKLSKKLLIGEKKWACTFFEITTVMAFEHFTENDIDIAVIETGMGGRFDSTNILSPILSIITSIDMDHWEYLGNTIEEIASEKAGIIKDKTPVVISKQKADLTEIFKDIAQTKQADFFDSNIYCKPLTVNFNPDFTTTISLKTSKFFYHDLRLNLPGQHQIQNLLTAICSIENLKTHFDISKQNIYDGLKNIQNNTGHIGRITNFEIQFSDTVNHIILDAGHNPGAIKKLIETLILHRPDIKKWNFIYASMLDKDIQNILKLIKPICDVLILTKPNIKRAIELEQLKKIAEDFQFNKIETFENIQDAVQSALRLDKPLVISGSFYLAGEALPLLEKMLKFQG